jgi:hypothetical protein
MLSGDALEFETRKKLEKRTPVASMLPSTPSANAHFSASAFTPGVL